MVRLSCYPGGESYLLVAGVALVLVALVAIWPVRRGTSRAKRLTLAAVRLATIVMIVLAMLRPTLVYTETKKQSASLIVLADRSRSMSVPDSVGGKTRWEILRRTLADGQDALEELAGDFEVKAYAFDADVHPVEMVAGKITLGDSPEGRQTAIGSALEDVLRLEAGKRLLGIILLSDGAQRAYAPRDLPAQTAAGRMKHLGCPLYTFPFGQSRGLGQAKDVAIKSFLANQNVFVKNELTVAGQVRVDGYVNREIPVRLLFETAPGKMEVVAEKNIKPTADGQLLPVEFAYAPQVRGEFKLTLEVEGQPGELVTTNNRLSTFVNVLAGGLNVLYLEGALRVEQKFLRRALDASPDIIVDYLRLDPRRPEIRPGNLGERFKPGKYEVYILGDLDSKAFRDSELKDLAETVSAGAGLIMLGGFHSFGPGGYGATSLGKVLPVDMDRFERQNFGEPIRGDLHLPGPLAMRPTQLGLNHFALMLAGKGRRNQAAWAQLPPLEGANRFRGTSAGALVLATDNQNRSLLVAQQYGAGRVMAFAGDSTWHWWMRGFETAHKRFWRQVILWLAHKDQSIEGNVWIKLSARRFSPGQRVQFTVGAQGPTGEPLEDATFDTRITLPDGKMQPLKLVRQAEQMAGSLRDSRTPGDYAIEVTAKHDGQVLGTARSRFLVFRQDLELDNASADVTTMESLAAMTGGQSLAPEQLPELLERLGQTTEELEVRTETKRTLWDCWPFFLLLVGLLGVEWYLRKRWGLV